MSNPFTIRIFVPGGDPEGVRIIDRITSTGKFFAFPRTSWDEIKNREEIKNSGIYILTGYANPNDELPTIYVGKADVIKTRIEQHLKGKDFWDKAVIFVSDNINDTHAKWLEHTLIDRLNKTKRTLMENGNSPQEPNISEQDKAEMQVFLKEIYETLPLVGIRAFEVPRAVVTNTDLRELNTRSEYEKNMIIVPAQEEGFNRVFLGENSWYAVRISGGMLDSIKYIAGYQVAPISAVTHYAEVERIEPYGEEGKYKLFFKGKAIKLESPLISDLQQGGMQGSRYTSFEKFKKAEKMSGLF